MKRNKPQAFQQSTYLSELDNANTTKAAFTQEPGGYGGTTSQYRFNGSIWVPSYYHYDSLGNTTELTDDNETITDTYIYDAFGNLLNHTGTTINPFQFGGFIGYYTDPDTGNVYIRARIYIPWQGRWTSVDILLFVNGPNVYVAYFVPNDVDPSGMSPISAGAGLAACFQAAGYSALFSWYIGDDLCKGCYKGAVSCLFGFFGGAISGYLAQSGNPVWAKCAYGAGQGAASGAAKSVICESLCKGGFPDSRDVGCAVFTSIFNSILGCLVLAKGTALAQSEAEQTLAKKILTAVTTITGYDMNQICKMGR